MCVREKEGRERERERERERAREIENTTTIIKQDDGLCINLPSKNVWYALKYLGAERKGMDLLHLPSR